MHLGALWFYSPTTPEAIITLWIDESYVPALIAIRWTCTPAEIAMLPLDERLLASM